MIKLTKRKGFNFFRSYFDVYNELESKDDKVAFIDALLDRQFLGVKPTELTGMAKFAYISQTNSIDSQVKGYEDKTKTKLTPTEPPTLGGKSPPTIQVQEEVEVQVQVKQKKSIDDRKRDFTKSLQPYLDEFGKDLLNNFYEYWTEHGENDRKMRFEKQKSFGIKRRLTTWKKNDKGFANEKTRTNNRKGFKSDTTERAIESTIKRLTGEA